MSMIQVGIIGVIAAVLAVQLKGGKAEYGIYVSAAAGIILFSFIVDRLSIFVRTLEQIASYIDMDAGYLGIMLKMIGITYVAEFAAGICKDAGYGAVGTQIEIFGKLSVLAVSMPILLALIETLQVFLS